MVDRNILYVRKLNFNYRFVIDRIWNVIYYLLKYYLNIICIVFDERDFVVVWRCFFF